MWPFTSVNTKWLTSPMVLSCAGVRESFANTVIFLTTLIKSDQNHINETIKEVIVRFANADSITFVQTSRFTQSHCKTIKYLFAICTLFAPPPPPKKVLHLSLFLLGVAVVPAEIEDNAHPIFFYFLRGRGKQGASLEMCQWITYIFDSTVVFHRVLCFEIKPIF